MSSASFHTFIDGIARRHLLVGALLVAIAFAAFWPTLGNGFVMDDVYMVQENAALRDLSSVPALFASTPPGSINRGYYRPMMLTSFALDHALFGSGPAGFHAVNIVWHAATAWLVFLLLQHFLKRPVPSLLGALIFLLHPIQSEVVYLITYRATALSVFFLFAALLYYLRRRTEPFGARHALALGALFFASVTAKEMGVILPFLMLACDVITPAERRRPAALPYLTTAAIIVLYAVMRHLLCVPSSASYFGDASGAHVLRAMVVVEAYALSLLCAPRDLVGTYDTSVLPAPESFADPTLLAAAAVLVGFAYLALRLRKRAPLISLGIVFYFIALGPTYNIMRSPNLFAARFMYSAMFGFCLCVAYGASKLSRTARSSLAFGAAAVMVLSMFAVQANARAYPWHDEATFWRAIVASRPGSLQSHLGLATTLLHLRRYGEALPHYQLALAELSPSTMSARPIYGEAATCYSHVGDLGGALIVVERWLALHPDDPGFQQMRTTLTAAIARLSAARSAAGARMTSSPVAHASAAAAE